MKKVFLTLLILMPTGVWAHEGHGAFHGTEWHYLSSIVHLIPLVIVVAGLILIVRRYWVKHIVGKR